ncbi:hypothetical protein NDU88_001380 [Pleurodeles waltl]|uniref:Uncharacterized protein n=1 Tax=Pleurodeles waltl TaxID=8319 RepID=A0AAV7P3Q3_PLEWA|nr:hypothetical protein NDU88_001380 [Pleurodeles waltl]
MLPDASRTAEEVSSPAARQPDSLTGVGSRKLPPPASPSVSLTDVEAPPLQPRQALLSHHRAIVCPDPRVATPLSPLTEQVGAERPASAPQPIRGRPTSRHPGRRPCLDRESQTSSQASPLSPGRIPPAREPRSQAPRTPRRSRSPRGSTSALRVSESRNAHRSSSPGRPEAVAPLRSPRPGQKQPPGSDRQRSRFTGTPGGPAAQEK